MRPEQSIATARASVMVYDEQNKKWKPAGSSHGLSKVDLYHHFTQLSFRVVGRKLQDHEVSINCSIMRGLKYNQATPTFHQWRDNKQVYGLNFSTNEEAEKFASAMMRCLEVLHSGGQLKIPWPHAEQPEEMKENIYQQHLQEEVSMYQRRQQEYGQEMYDRDSQYSEEQEEDVYEGGEGLYEEYHSENNYYEQERRLEDRRAGQPLQEQNLANLNRQGSVRRSSRLTEPHLHQPHPGQHHHQDPCGVEDPYGISRPQVPHQVSGPGYFQSGERRMFSALEAAPGCPSPGADRKIQQTHSSSDIYQEVNNKDDQSRQRTKSASPTSFHPNGQTLQPAGRAQPFADLHSPQYGEHRGTSQYSPQPTAISPPISAPPPPPPPPPPPMPPATLPGKTWSQSPGIGLAEGLQNVKLSRKEDSDTASGKGSIGRGGMANMMDEMQRTLARRRQKVDTNFDEEGDANAEKKKENVDKPETQNPIKNLTPTKLKLQELFNSPKMNTACSLSKLEVVSGNRGLELVKNKESKLGTTMVELEALKLDILKEMREEIGKAKMEIIDIIREELNKSRTEA